MDFINELTLAIQKVEEEKRIATEELEKLEKDFTDVKLNPYGITSIDFSRRQELLEDTTKMEGVIMGLNLAMDTFVTSSSDAVS